LAASAPQNLPLAARVGDDCIGDDLISDALTFADRPVMTVLGAAAKNPSPGYQGASTFVP
jgi:hypothetical protein